MARFIRVSAEDHDKAYKVLSQININFYCHQVAFEVMNEDQMGDIKERLELFDIKIIDGCVISVNDEIEFELKDGNLQDGRIKSINGCIMIVAYENKETPDGPYLNAVVNVLTFKSL